MTYAEIGEVMDISPAMVGFILEGAKKKMRKHLKQRGIRLEDLLDG